jgi:tRNA pseudouridine55 synthase
MNIVVSLNKCRGITSHDAVTAVKKTFKVRKAGHTGTLDPIATGLMLVCLNEATKIAGLVESFDKEYIVTAKLGESTDTYDSEGKAVRSADPSAISLDNIRQVLQEFVGEIEQVPPMYSAIKMNGQPLYKLARKGIEVERKPRRVIIKSIEILEFTSPFLRLKVSCSKGTYIRSICNDLGDALGVGAHMTELVRTRIGDFRIEDSAEIDQLPEKPGSLFSIDKALAHLAELRLDGDDLKKAKNGNQLSLSLLAGPQGAPGALIRLKDADGRLFGIGKVMRDSIKIKRLLFL